MDVREGRGAVFRIDKEPSGIRDSDENAGRICLSYVFGVFPIPVLVLEYLVAYAFKDDLIVVYFYFILTFLALVKCVAGTMTAFVASLNIRD